MIRLIETISFVSLAAAVHLGAWSFAPELAGDSAGGEGGDSRQRLVASDAAIAALVERWDTPPDLTQAEAKLTAPATERTAPTVLAMTAPSLQKIERPALPQVQRAALPTVDTTPAARPAPEPEVKPVARLKPVARPEPAKKPVAAKAQQPAQKSQPRKAAGNRKAAVAGTGGTSTQQTQSKQALNRLQSDWGARIHSKIRRSVRNVSNLENGVAKLELLVSSSGKLQRVRVIRSSGNAAIDKAALQAVKRAGRFPKAPKGLSEPSYIFRVPVRVSS